MATSTDCLPWWHNNFAHLSTGHGRPKIRSGCSVSGGNVNCNPESMRNNAEAELRKHGYWTKGKMPLGVYTFARYAASEVGGGTPEEKVAVMEAALNRVRGTSTSTGWYPTLNAYDGVNQLLLYRQGSGHSNYGYYGPIHSSGGGAPYGRWAATNADPGVDDLLIADFVLSGQSDNFAHGAVTQYGPDVRTALHPSGWARGLVPRVAQESGYYWVGPLPGVDHWHTFLYRQDKSIAPGSAEGQQLIAFAQTALNEPMQRPSWVDYPVCRKPIPKPLIAVGGVVVAGLLWWILSKKNKIPERYQIPWMGLSGNWVAYTTSKKDPIRWDSKGIMRLSATETLLIFPADHDVPESSEYDRRRVWTGSAKSSTDGIRIARYSMRDD